MRHARQESPTWPFLLVLVVLLVFTATAPRGWEQVARRQPLGELLPEAGARLASKTATARRKASRAPKLASSRVVQAHVELPVTRQAPPVIEQPLTVSVPVQAGPAADVGVNQAATMGRESQSPAAALMDVNPTVLEPLASVQTATEPTPARPAAAAQRWWPVPNRLLAELHALQQQPAVGAWAARASALVQEFIASGPPSEDRTGDILLELRSLVAAPGNFLTARPGGQLAQLRKAQFALSRRLDFWQRVIDCQSPAAQNVVTDRDAQRLAQCLSEVENQTSASDAGAAWRSYLLLDRLRQSAAGQNAADGRKLARAALGRLENPSLTAPQREFLASQPLVDLRNALRGWAAEPVDLRQLLEHIEQFELTGLPSQAGRLAGDFNRLADSDRPGDEDLARLLDTDYRNANLRLSLSPELLNRLVPPQRPRLARVRDLFMGHPTEGWSSTDAQVAFRLIPDLHRLHVALEARGQTWSEADTSNGPVLLHTHSDSEFRGWKEVTVGPDGVQSVPAEAEADSSPRLRWVKSDLDFIPIVGMVVRDIARAQHEDSEQEVRSQSRRKIRREVTEQIDSELAPRIARANERLKQRIIDPLEGLGVETVMIEARTSADRLTTRLRLAGQSQLAGSGPRPRAPANCLASVQMHQSALNNICQQLGWEGKTFTLAQLREEFSTKLRLEMGPPPASVPQDLTLTFAAENAIHIVCDEGRVQLNLAFARLHKPPESFRDFVVRVHYKPDLEQSAGLLVRDGTVQLIGDRLRPKAQLALRGIFSKTFPPSRSIRIIPAGITERPGLAELRVVQCEIRDGWIGLAFDVPGRFKAEQTIARQPADSR